MLGHEGLFGCSNKCGSKVFGGYFGKTYEVTGTALLIIRGPSFNLLYAPCELIFKAHL